MNIVQSDNFLLNMDDFITSTHIIGSNSMNKPMDMGKLDKNLPDTLDKIEKEIIIHYLKDNNNNKSITAKKLGIKRQTLQHKLKKYKI